MSLPYTGDPHILSADDVLPAEGAQRVVDKCNDATSFFAAQHFAVGRRIAEHRAPQIQIALLHVSVGAVPGPDALTPITKVNFGNVSGDFAWDASDPMGCVLRVQAAPRVAINSIRVFTRIKTAPGNIARTIAPRVMTGQGYSPMQSEEYFCAVINACFGYVDQILVLGFGYYRDT